MNSALVATLKNTQLFSGPLSTKYTLRIRNLCAQHDTVAESKKCHTVTCVRVNAIRTILQFTLVTHGHLFRVKLGATKGTNIPIITHNILIIIVLLCRCGPYMCRYVFPWTIWRVPYLSSNQKLLQMQEYTHVLMQLRTGSPPYVPYDAPVPHACKQVLKGGNATSPLHSRGSPKEGEQNQKSKPTLGVTMMPLRAPSITKYGSLVRPDAQIVALRAHCARTALKAPPKTTATPKHGFCAANAPNFCCSQELGKAGSHNRSVRPLKCCSAGRCLHTGVGVGGGERVHFGPLSALVAEVVSSLGIAPPPPPLSAAFLRGGPVL